MRPLCEDDVAAEFLDEGGRFRDGLLRGVLHVLSVRDIDVEDWVAAVVRRGLVEGDGVVLAWQHLCDDTHADRVAVLYLDLVEQRVADFVAPDCHLSGRGFRDVDQHDVYSAQRLLRLVELEDAAGDDRPILRNVGLLVRQEADDEPAAVVHDVLADRPAGICEAVRILVGLGEEE